MSHASAQPACGSGPESILPAVVMDSGLALQERAPRNDSRLYLPKHPLKNRIDMLEVIAEIELLLDLGVR